MGTKSLMSVIVANQILEQEAYEEMFDLIKKEYVKAWNGEFFVSVKGLKVVLENDRFPNKDKRKGAW